MQLKEYQNIAIKKLLDRSLELLGHAGNKKLVFKAPTGSGKTIMMAEFLKKLVEGPGLNNNLSFIWTAPRQLHTQSKEKLELYFEGSRALKCSYFEDLDEVKIGENEILLFNWESINKKDNLYIRENERDDNLTNVLERTQDDGRTIILVIDESHHHATSEISQKIIADINPKLTIEVSATPTVESPDEIVTIDIEDVKEQGMIKKGVVLNEGFKNLLEGNKIKTDKSISTDEIVIDEAMKKRKEIIAAFEKEGVAINPLVLIQLPDRKSQAEDVVRERVEKILKGKYKTTTTNNKLAIWLSGEHINKEDVEKSSSDVDVLIFKQAIALGWDCPRAHILVLFREWHSPVFSIQTIGRIMRMPEPDKGHYENEVLNQAYVYTNLTNIEIKDDIAKDYITIQTSHRDKTYKPLDLVSCHSVRHREKTRLSPIFIKIFMEEAKKYQLKEKINRKAQNDNVQLISDWKAEYIDNLKGVRIEGDSFANVTSYDLQRLFDYFIRNSLTPFHPEARSIGRLKEAIYKYFNDILLMDYGLVQEEIVRTILSETNTPHFRAVINVAKDEYIKQVIDRHPILGQDKKWNIPEKIRFNQNYVLVEVKKSIMSPFFRGREWRTEKAFIEVLENSKKVEWWFKNGDRDHTYFAVPYENNGPSPFYIDFIVQYKDGRIGLFDTKAGNTIKIAGPKIKGLNEYLKVHNKKQTMIWGGIIANTDQRNFQGKWVIFDKCETELKDGFANWDDLDI